jgi:hypothetical protein
VRVAEPQAAFERARRGEQVTLRVRGEVAADNYPPVVFHGLLAAVTRSGNRLPRIENRP